MKNKSQNKRRTHRHSQHLANTKTTSKKINVNLFGKHAVTEAWTNPNRVIDALYITDDSLEDFHNTIVDAQKKQIQRPEPKIVEKEKLAQATNGHVHQGIGIQCRPLPEIDIGDIVRMEETKERSVIVILDQVTDPHNVGAIIRSASAFGAAGLIMQRKHAPELVGVLAKTACGGVEHLPVAFETNLARTIETLQEAGYFAIGLDERGEQTLADSPQYEKTIIVLGAEGSGLRRLVGEKCDILARLPTKPPIASLNVSNAAAISLYDLCLK